MLGVSLLGDKMRYFKGKNVLVYGMGRSGQSASKLLYECDACVSIYDEDKGFSNMFCFEEDPLKNNYDLVVVSPGIKVIDNPIIEYFQKSKTTVISELDLGSSFCQGKIIAVTGTNGKTTVTSMIGEILKRAGKEVFVCGNIGLPISSIALKTTRKSYIVCEVSNFQLELSTVFNPYIACMLNLQEDHIDRHGNFAEYVRVKNKITQNFTNNLFIYNLDDSNSKLLELPKNVSVNSKHELKKGCFIKDSFIYFNKIKVMDVAEVPLLGEKNLENVLAVVNTCMHLKIKPQIIREGIMEFCPLPHRLERVGNIRGVEYINDSKSTNTACTEMAISSLKRDNLILLVGGQNKNCDFESLFSLNITIKEVVCFGDAGEEIQIIAKKKGYKTSLYSTMKEAVLDIKKRAEKGDCVLLSPGCASFDEFSSYAVRGQIFKELVLRND